VVRRGDSGCRLEVEMSVGWGIGVKSVPMMMGV
jgi:hypothetical protein